MGQSNYMYQVPYAHKLTEAQTIDVEIWSAKITENQEEHKGHIVGS